MIPLCKKPGFQFAMGMIILVAVIAGWNLFIARNRKVEIVNGLPNTTLSVKVDGRPPIEIPAQGRKQITLAEGTHEAELLEPEVIPKFIFSFSSDWWARFVRRPVYILDPARSADIRWEEATYAPDGSGIQVQDNQFDVRLGVPFTAYKHVDYQFQEFPTQLPMKPNSNPVKKSRVSVSHEGPDKSAQLALSMGEPATTIMEFLEKHLQVQPEQENLLRLYTYVAMKFEKEAVCRKF